MLLISTLKCRVVSWVWRSTNIAIGARDWSWERSDDPNPSSAEFLDTDEGYLQTAGISALGSHSSILLASIAMYTYLLPTLTLVVMYYLNGKIELCQVPSLV